MDGVGSPFIPHLSTKDKISMLVYCFARSDLQGVPWVRVRLGLDLCS